MRDSRMWMGALLGAALTVMVACSTSSHGSDHGSSGPPPAPAKVQPATPWDKTLDRIKPDGTVDTATALSAFVQAIGPIPGVTSPGPSNDVVSGTIAVRWVFAHWRDLTAQQQAAVRTDLGAPASSGTHRFVGPDVALPTSKSNDPDMACLTADSPDTLMYRGLFNDIVDDIASHLHRQLSIRDHVFFAANTTTKFKGGTGAAAMYTWGCSDNQRKSESTESGKVTGCTIHVNPDAQFGGAQSDSVQGRLVHEVMHCFFYDLLGTVQAEANLPDWFGEGAPSWVQSVLGPGDESLTSFWDRYLTVPQASLAQRTYTGVGFFVHLAETGTDPWGVLDAMATAMAKDGSTATGWRVANPTGDFLDTWGSSFAQGRYPGSAWTSGGPNLQQYQTGNYRDKDLPNDGFVPFSSNPAAAGLLNLNVTAEIVQVQPDAAAHGQFSIGDGSSVDLATAAGQTYCTLAAADCKCPADSAKADTTFTHLTPGTHWLGLTGGLDAASVQVKGLSFEDFCQNSSPIVGTWKSTAATARAGDGRGQHTSSGGAGVVMTVDAKGAVTVDYTGMSQMSFEIVVHHAGQTLTDSGVTAWKGTQPGTVKLPTGKARSGSWAVTAGSDDVAVTGTQDGETRTLSLDYYLSQGRSPDMISPLTPGGSWRLSGNTLTLNVRYAGMGGYTATGTWQFARVGKR